MLVFVERSNYNNFVSLKPQLRKKKPYTEIPRYLERIKQLQIHSIKRMYSKYMRNRMYPDLFVSFRFKYAYCVYQIKWNTKMHTFYTQSVTRRNNERTKYASSMWNGIESSNRCLSRTITKRTTTITTK